VLATLITETSSDSITGIAGWMTGVIDALGPIGVGLIIVAETVFPPIPSEVVLPAAGYLAGLGQLGFWATVVCATVGSVLGALVLYAGGRWVGAVRLGRLAAWLPLMSAADVERAWIVFERWQQPVVFFGRLIPGVRSLVSIPAGAKQMPLVRFVVLTALGSAIWNFVLIGAGWWLGDRYGATATVNHWMNTAVIAGAGLLVAWFVVSKLRARRRATASLSDPLA
jgi:membrane protein DedA with SNARE-associated domain